MTMSAGGSCIGEARDSASASSTPERHTLSNDRPDSSLSSLVSDPATLFYSLCWLTDVRCFFGWLRRATLHRGPTSELGTWSKFLAAIRPANACAANRWEEVKGALRM